MMCGLSCPPTVVDRELIFNEFYDAATGEQVQGLIDVVLVLSQQQLQVVVNV